MTSTNRPQRGGRQRGGRAATGGSSFAGATRDGPLRPGREAELALIVATLANRQLQVSKSMSAYYAVENERLGMEREQLENDRSKAEEDARAVIETVGRRLDAVTCDNARLKHEMDNALGAAQHQVRGEMSKLNDTLEKRDLWLMELRKRVEWLEQELESVRAFRDARDAHNCEMEALKKAYADEKADHEANARNLRMHLLEERVRFRADGQLLKQKYMDDVREGAMELLKEKTREVDALNQTLLEEKTLLLSDVEMARDQARVLRQENDKLRRDAALATSAETEHIACGARQRREISALKEQVRTLEEKFHAVVQDYEKRLRNQTKEHATTVGRLTEERDEARHAAESFRRELVKLRSLSRQMIERRTELEVFFYEALTDVRRALLLEQRGQTHTANYQNGGPTFHRFDKRLKRGDEPLLISDHDVSSLVLPSLLSCRNKHTGTLHNKELLLEDRNFNPCTLPLILPPRVGDLVPTQGNRLVPAKRRHDPEIGALAQCSTSLGREPVLGSGSFSEIPGTPKRRDLRSIEISQLSWKDKERVLQILFRHLQGKSNTGRSKQCASTDDAEFLLGGGVAVNPMTNAFLTE